MVCTKCGKTMPEGSAVCPFCGSAAETENHWYLVEKGAAVELTESELTRRIREGSVLPGSKICIRGAAAWSDAKDTPLGYLFDEPRPAPQPEPAPAPQPAPQPVQTVYTPQPVQPVPVQAAPVQPAQPAGGLEEPVSMGTWFGVRLLLAVPTLNFIMCIIWACNRKVRKSIRNLARLELILIAVAIVLIVLAVVIALAAGVSVMEMLENAL